MLRFKGELGLGWDEGDTTEPVQRVVGTGLTLDVPGLQRPRGSQGELVLFFFLCCFGFAWAETNFGFALVFVSFGQACPDLHNQLYHPSDAGVILT